MTPLFPKDKAPITIEQGNTGDCYLLTAIDCIINSGEEGLQLVKSMFTESEGGVTIRIKRTELFTSSNNLTPERLKDKYTYSYDPSTNEDVFFIDNDRLQVIDDSWAGVRTNALAIKILERISSYYYTGYWPNDDMNASIVAHNISARHSVSSTEFVGKFIGVEAHDTRNIDDIIKLKTISPEQPVYISMSYGKADSFGVIHGRHALRIDKIVPNVENSYDFILINPHNNQKREQYTLDEIKKRNYRFSIYNTNKAHYDLTTALLKCPTEIGQYVFQQPKLYELLQLQQTLFPLNESTISAFYTIFKNTPYLASILKVLSKEDVQKLSTCIVDSNGNKKLFILSLMRSIPRYDLISIIYDKEMELDFKTIGELVSGLVSDPLIKNDLSRPEFLSLLIQAAVRSKSRELHCKEEEAKKLVESGLARYYFDGSEISLTRSANLRALIFNQKLFDQNDIMSLFKPNALLPWAAADYIRSNGIVFHSLSNALKQIDLDIVNNDFLVEFLNNYEKNPRLVFIGLFQLSKLNPELAKTMCHLLTTQMDQFFKISLNDFTKDLYLEAPNGFEYWFKTIQEPLDGIKAQHIIDRYIKKINKYTFSFNDCYTTDSVQKQIVGSIREVDRLVLLKSDLLDALAFFGAKIDSHPALSQALEHKRQCIRDEGELLIKELNDATKVIEAYINAIRNYTVSFKEITIEADIERHSRILLAGLEDLTQNKADFVAAIRTLGLYNPNVVQIRKEVEAKERELQQLSLKQFQLLSNAKAVITKQVYEIDLFDIGFEQCSSSEEIEKQAAQLLKQLSELPLSNGDLVKAQHDLGISSGFHPSIQKALDAKKQTIELDVGKMKDLIKSLDIIKSYERQINNFPVHFDGLKSITEIENQTRILVAQLYAITQDKDDLAKAHHAVNSDGYTSRTIQTALEFKIQEIEQVSRKRMQQINEAKEVISRYEHQIGDIDVHFEGSLSEEGITRKSRLLLVQVDSFLQPKEDLINAQLVLGISDSLHPDIQDAIQDKRGSINRAAERQSKILEALELISGYEHAINSLEVNFDNLKTKWDVTREQKLLLNALEDIQNNIELRTAQQTLENLGYSHMLNHSAFNKKKQEIDLAASLRTGFLSDAEEVIKVYERRISNLPVSYAGITTIEGVKQKSNLLTSQLEAITNNATDLIRAQQILGVTSHPSIRVATARKEKREDILNDATRVKDKICSMIDAQKVLDQIKFDDHLGQIRLMKNRLKENAQNYDNYLDAADAAKALYKKIKQAKTEFIHAGKPNKINREELQRACLLAIDEALPVLGNHRGWKQELANFVSDLLSVLSLGIANLVTGRGRFFNTQTESAHTTSNFAESIKELSVTA